MKFQTLTLENFMPFRERVELLLADQGLVLVQGDNRVSHAASSNGVGKTAIVDALSWALYGQTLRGMRGDDVACRFTEGPCRVRLEMDGLTVARERRPARFEAWGSEGPDDCSNVVRDAKSVQARIEQHLGFGFNVFKNAVVFGQGVFDRFAVADQAEQMRMVDEIQGVDFRKALDRAKAWRDTWQEKLDGMAGRQSLLEQAIEQAEIGIKELEAARERFQGDKAAQLAALVRRVAVARGMLAQAKTRASEMSQLLRDAKATLAAEAEQVRLEKAGRDADIVLQRARAERQAADGAVTQSQDRLRDLLKQSRCPTCYRPISASKGAAEVQAAADGILGSLREAAGGALVREMAAQAVFDKATKVLEAHRTKHPSLVADAATARAVPERQRLAAESVAAAERDLAQQEADAAAERARKWEGAAALAAQRTVVADAQRDLAELVQEAAKAGATVRAAEYWVEAFSDRGIRSLLFDSVAGFLTERAAHHLDRLAAGEARLDVSALTKLKSGAMKERLSVEAGWEWGAESYGGSSAGQGGRLDLALLAALQDLAERRSAKPFPLRCFDEPEAHLDARGKEMLAAWVHDEALQRGTVLLMTHDAELLGLVEPDKTWTVVLGKDGAHVESS